MFYNNIRYRLLSYENNTSEIKERTLSIIKGVPIVDIEAMIDNVIDRVINNKIYKKSLNLIEEHKASSDTIYLATAGPKYIATRLSNSLGLSGAIGTEIEIKDGICTGNLIGTVKHGLEKAKAIRELIVNNSYENKTLYCYSDSIKDLPMLKASNVPNVVNPDKKLRKIAESNNWSIYNTKNILDNKFLIICSNIKTFIKN
jgi:HAD superfamily hydrolase (TIGR01490 family)